MWSPNVRTRTGWRRPTAAGNCRGRLHAARTFGGFAPPQPLAHTAPESFGSGHFIRAKSEHTYKRTEQGTLQRSKQEMEGRGEHLTGEHERWRRNQWLLPVGRGQREGEGHHTPEWCQVSAVLAISRERRAYQSQKPRSL